MPMYPVRCDKCGENEVFARMSECDNLKCPTCDQPATKIPARTRDVNRRFVGSESLSIMEGWPKGQVQAARKLVGSELEGCVLDNGRVAFKDRAQQKAYVRKIEQIEAASGIEHEDDPD